MHKIWLLQLVLPIRYGRLLTGSILFSVLYALFYMGVEDESVNTTPALFFSLVIAYIIPVFSYITAKSQESLLELRSCLSLDDQEFAAAQASLEGASWLFIVLCLGSGALCGFIHMSFVRGSAALAVAEMLDNAPGFLSTLGALLVWMVMTTVIAMLVRQARLFARLGARHVNVSLLNIGRLLPFARVSISSSLAIIGALALFPLIGMESGLNLVEIVPGAIATLVPLIGMFIIPVWPLHCRIVEMKAQQLAELNEQIEARLDARGGIDVEAGMLEQVEPILNYRREIAQVSTWPFDVGNMTKLAFYLIIPPLTWVAAALIENLVDSVI